MFEGGTSMATPLVAGCAAVVRAFLRKQGLAEPSAALMKAMIINGAHPLAGQYVPSEAAWRRTTARVLAVSTFRR
jgi:subtilisin family serine protease